MKIHALSTLTLTMQGFEHNKSSAQTTYLIRKSTLQTIYTIHNYEHGRIQQRILTLDEIEGFFAIVGLFFIE